MRPASEIAARLLWERLDKGPVRPADLLIAATACGASPGFRSARARTTPFASGHQLEFLAPDRIAPRLERMLVHLNHPPRSTQPLLHAAEILFDTLLIHPLPDGNGRLSRLLFQLALRQTIGLRAPVFPLGPAFALNRSALIGAYLAWEFDHNAQPLFNFIAAALTTLVELYGRSTAGLGRF